MAKKIGRAHRKLQERLTAAAQGYLEPGEEVIAVASGSPGNPQAGMMFGAVGALVQVGMEKRKGATLAATTGFPVEAPAIMALTQRRLLCWKARRKELEPTAALPLAEIESIEVTKPKLAINSADGRLVLSPRGYEPLKLAMLPSMAEQMAEAFAHHRGGGGAW